MKEDVEKSIPIKEETIVEVELTLAQKRYYRAILEKNFQFMTKNSSSANVPSLLNIMMKIRKCCIHPYLIRDAEKQILMENGLSPQSSYEKQMEMLIKSSGKMILLDKLFKKLKEGGHKILVFSQMVKCLNLIEEMLNYHGYGYERLDGSIRGDLRQAAIDRFCASESNEEKFVFLLCTGAGGVGINLTVSDTAIIFDSDWNPQNDIQAQARCHRIGQLKPVKVYKIVTRGTYEREMLDRTGLKLGLDKAILQRMDGVNSKQEEPESADLSKNEVEILLKQGAYGLVMENDEDSIKFCEEDIDQILERRAMVITHGNEQQKNKKQSSFS